MDKTYLIFGATSDMASSLIKKLLSDSAEVFAVSRSRLETSHEKLYKFNIDLSKENEINDFFKQISSVKFDAVINFQGVAITSPVEFLETSELKKQFDISLFSLLVILKNLKGMLHRNSMIINVSSMASFGIFPFLSPYSMAKASSDILLNCYEIETGIKTVSVKPGVVKTKFWDFCIKENEKNFSAFKDGYESVGKFLINNAKRNSNKGVSPLTVSKLIYKILRTKNPKASYLVGHDAYFASIASRFKNRFMFKLIRNILEKRIKNDK